MLLAFVSQAFASLSVEEAMKHHNADLSPFSYSLMAGNNTSCEKASLSSNHQGQHGSDVVPDCCKGKQHCPMDSCLSVVASVSHRLINITPDVRQKHPKNSAQALIKRHFSLYRPPIFV